MTLKIGDKVRFTQDYNSQSSNRFVRKGEAGTVKGRPYGDLVTVDLGDRRKDIVVYAYRVEKIEEPTSKFKVGDRVRLHYPHPKFETGMVVRLTGSNTVEVLPDGGYRFPPHCAVTRGAGSYPSSELTKVESVPFKLERGDRVVNRKTGREGEVFGGQVWDTKVWTSVGVPVKAIEEYEEWHPGTYDLIKKDAPW